MSAWNVGKVVEHKQWNNTLYSLYVESDIEPFEAGQFVKIALEINGELVGRPYSLVNPPDSQPLELFYIEVPNGLLTSHLVNLKPGDNIQIATRAHGFMILDEVPQAKHLWLMATGTGVGPFLSMLMTDKPWQRFERAILVYAVRTLSDLCYQERITQILAMHPGQFSYIPFLSRESSDFAMTGRIPQAIIDGRLEARAGIGISAEDSQVMLCGNPQMVKETNNTLTERGLKKHRRFEPGQITVENYW
ncbi:MAG: ferredoxin--NADP(+) reductase [Betaproteobacteria bacterium HGW-Betaproteobacteria-20]|nr:MAG: ferredoxin--NADP(+) reductase [Betaproteobacteria bacterium HGW-Betaproteobacteria-20]